MAGAFIEVAGSAVAKVADEDFAAEVKAFLDGRGIVGIEKFFARELVVGLYFLAEKAR